MLELPEAVVIAQQIGQTLAGKRIQAVQANQSPHKFAWFTGDPAEYPRHLLGKTIGAAGSHGGHVEVQAGDRTLIFSTTMRYYPAGEKLPPKHQLWLAFEDGSSFVATVQMWGAMLCIQPGQDTGLIDYPEAIRKPSPLSLDFDRAYFETLLDQPNRADILKLSAKAFLATEQRIPGLGNGALQDILWMAHIHPKRKLADLAPGDLDAMYSAVKSGLRQMADCGGRDTERDLFGSPGGYRTVLSKNTAGTPCPACGSEIKKEAYMGGSIYYCPGCQQV